LGSLEQSFVRGTQEIGWKKGILGKFNCLIQGDNLRGCWRFGRLNCNVFVNVVILGRCWRFIGYLIKMGCWIRSLIWSLNFRERIITWTCRKTLRSPHLKIECCIWIPPIKRRSLLILSKNMSKYSSLNYLKHFFDILNFLSLSAILLGHDEFFVNFLNYEGFVFIVSSIISLESNWF
jgi:hypothetical protein